MVEKDVVLQEYFVYFKKPQRISAGKESQDATDVFHQRFSINKSGRMPTLTRSYPNLRPYYSITFL